MEQKTNALKASSKVISIIMKIGYIAMIVAMCICVICLIFMAVTGGKTSIVLFDGITIGIADGVAATASEYIAMFIEYLIISVFLFAVFFLTQKMFGEISVTGVPFTSRYVKTIRIIGILIVAMTVIMGIIDTIITSFLSVKGVETFTEFPSIVFGAVVFCLSYIIDYGCALKNQRESE